ncbi:MAG: MCE family protein, partial [Stackebrandtia sp.]
MKRLARSRLAVAAAALILIAAGFGVWQALAGGGKHVVAEFSRAVGVYVGSDVRVLGVSVGEVTEVKPTGETVTVSMTVDDEYDIPAEATAMVIPPSVVADRYIEFTPAYTGGQLMEDGAELGVDRTVVPMELDEVYENLNEFADVLGDEESLGEAIEVARENLEGNGEQLGESLDSLAEVAEVLDSHSDDLWGTVDNLAEFTEALVDSDAQVQLFNDQLADVSTQLSDERDNLSEALSELTIALSDVSGFIDENADLLVENVEQLSDLSAVFARQQEALINILDYAPVALTNLDLAYNSRSGTLDTRDDLMGKYDPASFLCAQLVNVV